MSTLRARVQGGHIVVDGSTDLPEGTQLTLVMVDADSEMSPEERADLEAEIERGRGAISPVGESRGGGGRTARRLPSASTTS
jgi:hypothetical protein